MTNLRRSTHSPLLGTTVKLGLDCGVWRSERKAEKRIVGEIERLSHVFNVFDSKSQISLLRAGGSPHSNELRQLLKLAERWSLRSGGRFDPQIGMSDVNLNAIAKGWIVDRATEVVPGIRTLVLDAGGDVLHIGRTPIRVGVENPMRPYDNEPPLVTVKLHNAALATSGPARRGDHLVDPRTGLTPTDVLSASVIASDAATADVVATVLAVGSVSEGLEFAAEVELAVAIVDASGQIHSNDRWRSIE